MPAGSKVLIQMSNNPIEVPLDVKFKQLKRSSTEVSNCVCKMHFFQGPSQKNLLLTTLKAFRVHTKRKLGFEQQKETRIFPS